MNINKIKILFIIPSFGIGGVEKVVVDLANGLNKNKYHVSILTLSKERIESFNLLDPDINKYSLDFNKDGIRSLRFWLLGSKKIKDLLNNLKPDIVHTHTFFSHLFFLLIAFKKSKANFLHFRTIHSSGFYYENQKKLLNKIRLLSEKIAMKITNTYLISVSNAVHENNKLYFDGIVKEINTIHNGVDLKKYDRKNYSTISKKDFNLPESSLPISYVARLENGKNHDFLIDLWPDIINKFPQAILCFAGDGFLKEALLQKVKGKNLQDSIYFLGSINNIPELLSITEIGVFPSSFEGFSLVMLEKFAMELAVVASDIKPFHEIANNNVNAFLVPINEKKIFIEKIVSLCSDTSLRKKIGENARSAVQKFSIENMVNSHEKYYEQILKNKY